MLRETNNFNSMQLSMH